MSRCLPFPPPGYVWNGVSGEALLELIKVQRERVKAEREKKKEKRRRKKEKKESEQGEIWKKKQGHHKRHKRLRSNEGEERSKNRGKSEYETQEMETSSLTAELEQPIPDSLYESSDNSQSIRRKRNNISYNECHNHGSLVQIDFQLQKHKTPESLSSKPDCSTRMMDSVVQKKLELPVEEQFSSASGMLATDVQEFVPPPLKELCRSSQRARFNMDEKFEITQIESQFRELVVNWIPPPLQIEHFDVGDQEWLFERKPPRSNILETSNASKAVLHHGNSMSCPYDQFLLHSSAMMDSKVQKKLELDPTPVKEQISSACGVPATDAQELATPPLRELVVNWIPPPLQIEHFDVGDQEWLFERKPPRSNILETSNASKDVLHHGNSMSCPYDQFLLHSSAMMDSKVQKKLELDPTPVKEQISSACGVPATDAQELATPPLKALCHSSSQGAGIDTDEKSEIAPTSSCSEISLLQIESKSRELVVNWLPPSLQFEPFDIGDQKWLFMMKQPRSDIRGTSTASYDVLHQGNFTQYPHAQYLSQANIYALPYTLLY